MKYSYEIVHLGLDVFGRAVFVYDAVVDGIVGKLLEVTL